MLSERIAKVVQCITCVADASTMQSLATSLTRFAKNVGISVAIAQAAGLVVTGIGVTDLLHRLGAISVRRLGRVPNADGRRRLLQNHRQGHGATIVVKVKTWL